MAYTGPSKVTITMNNGATIVGDITNNDDADEMTRLVDAWQSQRTGGFRINGRNGHADGQYRDIVRVDFSGGTR